MAMNRKEKNGIKTVIAESLRRKFRTYTPKGKTVMPFHTRLLGKDRMALFSFIQSLNTTFGTAIYEPVAEALAADHFAEVHRSYKSGGVISEQAQLVISDIKNRLEIGNDKTRPSQAKEVAEIRRVCRKGGEVKIKVRQADIYLVSRNGVHYPIDIKTAKPNVDGFEKYKENMLKWTATILHENPQARVSPLLAMPYNPDYPEEYRHWTIRGMVERGTQIKVGKEFWDFLANKSVFDDLLDCFEEVGMEMRDEIDEYFADFQKGKKGD